MHRCSSLISGPSGPLVLRSSVQGSSPAFGWGVPIFNTAISTAFHIAHSPGGFVSGVAWASPISVCVLVGMLMTISQSDLTTPRSFGAVHQTTSRPRQSVSRESEYPILPRCPTALWCQIPSTKRRNRSVATGCNELNWVLFLNLMYAIWICTIHNFISEPGATIDRSLVYWSTGFGRLFQGMVLIIALNCIPD